MGWASRPGEGVSSFPLPVAVLPEDAEVRFLISVTALFHLLPMKLQAHSFFSADDSWAALLALGAEEEDLVRSNRSKTLKRKFGAMEGEGEAQLNFKMYMGRPRLLVCTLAVLVGHVRQKLTVQTVAISILRGMCSWLPGEVNVGGLEVVQGEVRMTEWRARLKRIGGLELWKESKVVSHPLLPAVSDARMSLGDVLWFAFRNRSRGGSLLHLCETLVLSFSSVLSVSLGDKLHDRLPKIKLPQDIQAEVLMALKSQDKCALQFHRILGQKSGASASLTVDPQLKEIYSDPSSLRSRFTTDISIAYFTTAQVQYAAGVEKQTTIEGDCLMFDASRVSAKEVCVVHLFSEGTLYACPIQILPDSPARLSRNRAQSLVIDVLRGKSLARKRPGESTRSYGAAVFNSLRHILPFKTFGIYQASSLDHPGLGDRSWSEPCKAFFRWSPTSRVSTWCLADELQQEAATASVRVLTMACDEGSQGYSLFMHLANAHRFRTLFIRDPPPQVVELLYFGPEDGQDCPEQHHAGHALA